jgi:predicted NBD/HSP70 family sugar kinase
MGVSKQTMSRTVRLLLDRQVVTTSDKGLSLHPALGVLVGVDVSPAKVTVAISNLGYELLNDPRAEAARCEIPIGDPQASLQAIAALIARQLEATITMDKAGERLIGVGLALPGLISRKANPDKRTKEASEWDRSVHGGLYLPGWDEVRVPATLAVLLREKHGICPPRHHARRVVWVENDASAGALGVHTQAKRRLGEDAPDDLFYVRVTTGIGSGIINKGHLINGGQGFAGELGHVMVNPAGPLCTTCGGRGCLAMLASDRAIVHQLGGVLGTEHQRAGDLTGVEIDRRLDELLKSGHPAVDRALWDAGWHLGTVLASVCCILNPSWIVLDGKAAGHEPPADSDHRPAGHDDRRPFIAAVKHAIHRNAMPQVREKLELKLWETDLRDDAQQLTPELLGALALVVDHLGDAYLLKPITEWMKAPKSREGPLVFT